MKLILEFDEEADTVVVRQAGEFGGEDVSVASSEPDPDDEQVYNAGPDPASLGDETHTHGTYAGEMQNGDSLINGGNFAAR